MAHREEKALQLIQFLNASEDDAAAAGGIFLNEENLSYVLNRTNGYPLSIICICGPSRQGKSFILGYILRCLDALEKDVDVDWMDWANKDKPLTGFKFQNGVKPETQGIWIWSKPFNLKVGPDGDQPLSVILIDTQGTYDEFTNSRTMASIVGLSLLLSSSMVFNFFKNLQEDVLSSLESYINYGKLALQEQSQSNSNNSSSFKPFQKLMFLIRDWNNPAEFPYGGKGGKAFLKEKLELKPNQPQEAKAIRETIKSCFEELDCYLMPFPGDAAIERSFSGSIGELNQTFAKKLEDFISTLINPDELTGKHVFGEAVSAMEFQSLLEMYIDIFNSAETPSPQSMLEATTQLVNQSIVQKAIKKYIEVIKKHQRKHTYLRGKIMQAADKQARAQAMAAFANGRKFGDTERIDELEEKLEKDITIEFKQFKSQNDEKWEKFIQGEIETVLLTFEDEMNDEFLLDAENPSQYFDEAVIMRKGKALVKNSVDDLQDKLDDICPEEKATEEILSQVELKLDEILQNKFILENQSRQKDAEKKMVLFLTEVSENYEATMKQWMEENLWMDSSAFQKHQESVKAKTQLMFQDGRKNFLPKGKPSQKALSELDQKLELQLEKIFNALLTSQSLKQQEAQLQIEKYIHVTVSSYSEELEQAFELDIDGLQRFHAAFLTNTKAAYATNCPFQNYSQHFQSNWQTLSEKLDEVFEKAAYAMNQAERFAQEKLNEATEESFNLYRNEMSNHLKSNPCPSELKRLHEKSLLSATNHFEGFDLSSSRQGENQKLAGLYTKIEAEYVLFQANIKESDTLAKSNAENLLADCQAHYDAQMKVAIDAVRSEDALQEKHEEALSKAVDEFKEKCKVKDQQFMLKCLTELESGIEETFEELLELFELKLGEQDTVIAGLVVDARRFYDQEMSQHFRNSEFIRPTELEELHKRTTQFCIDRCAERQPLNQGQKVEITEALKSNYQKYVEENDMNLECEEVAIGIDLGTTYSCVAVYAGGKVRVIPNTIGKNTTPSYVAFNSDGSNTVGESAKSRAYENPENTIFDAKRIIGRKITDPKLQQDMKMWPFTVEDDGGVPKISVRGSQIHPEQVSAEVLKEMRRSAEAYLKRKVTKAVITVPAYFTDGQRQATTDAGKVAGLEVLTILTEPVAAAIAYKKQHAEMFGEGEQGRSVLIFDLGGGTFDVAVLQSSQGSLDVKSIGGDDHLGGEDFDRAVMEYCAAEFQRTTGLNLFDGKDSDVKQTRDDSRRRLKRLQGECERKKIELTAARRVEVSVDSLFKNKDLSVVITRDKFEELNASLFQKTIKIVETTLNDAKMGKEQIQDIVLVGGSTRIPKIQELLRTYFNGKALDSSINPDEAVAWGAAMKAAIMNGSITKGSIDFTKIQDVTPMSMGVEVYGGGFSIIIPKNTKIPVKAKERYRTAHNNQTAVQVTIYQGEEVVAVHNKHLGDFYLNGIPPKDAGAENIDVEMVINSQGILHVNAVCSSTGGKTGITVTENKQRMSRALIKNLLAAAEPNAG